ncbi:protein LAZ1 [Tanacetum coccineum]
MVRNVTNEEIKTAMFDIGDDRAPGPDGFTPAFFKKNWDIVGNDVCNAMREFFINGQLLKEINHTFLALIPKVSTPLKVTDYRSISCCNVLYKCISKILTNRIIDGLKEAISENQSTFIPGRRISDNILITQELMHNYHRNRGPPRCLFKVDIQKAYDTVDWNFLATILKCFGFHNKMVKWIMACVTSASLSLCINGDILGFFKGKRGLRQGDPISPYLFTMVMELVNICFADDLFIFTRGDVESAWLIMEALDEFKKSSGLVPSIPKSMVYFCNVQNHIKMDILSIMSFAEGTLPVKYLGVPFISSRLLNRDYIEQLMRGFLWCNGELKRVKAKVAWDIICLPKREGGLDIRSMEMIPPILDDIILYLQPMAHKRNVLSVVGRILVAAASYFIWVERNNRTFKNVRRSPDEICDIIIVTVRLKLLTFHFKNTAKLEVINSGLLLSCSGSSSLSLRLMCMEMDIWEIKEKLAERQEQMRIYEEDKRREEWNQKIKEDKRREEWNQKIEEVINLIQSFIL